MYEPKNRHLKKQAYIEYHRGLKQGAIVRPGICEACGKESKRIEGHHTDYAYPLEVIWLCFSCHREIHRDFWKKSPRTGRSRIHEDDKARKRAWWRKHRAKKQSEK